MAVKKETPSIDKILENKPEKAAIEDMPLETLADYLRYNKEARALNKKLRICRYPIKQAPHELHPQETIIFTNVNKSVMPVNVHVSNEMIHFDEHLTPGKQYTLPRCIVEHLAEKGTANWKRVERKDGSVDTVKESKSPRFAVRTIYKD